MKIVIQCAASKDSAAGYFRSPDGTPIKFVAHPESASANGNCIFARPDGNVEGSEQSWRDLVVAYNQEKNDNPLGLYPAWLLYLNPAYRRLVDKYGESLVYILSAGWGLIRSDFLTPQYDITFSASADLYKRRKARDRYLDLCQLDAHNGEHVIFFGGKSYLPLFCNLTESLDAERIVFFNSKTVPDAPDCRLIKYETRTRTNWHYACANDFVADQIEVC